MDHLPSSFFIDHSVVTRFDKRVVEETKAHLIILGSGGGNDTTLAAAAIADGNTIDFLFGVRDSEVQSAALRASKAKKWMRSLNDQGQDATARFYIVVCQSMEIYHRNMEHPCSFIWSFLLQKRLLDDIEEAFVHLKGMISENNIHTDE